MSEIQFFRVKPLEVLEEYREDEDYYYGPAIVRPMLDYANKILKVEWWEEEEVFHSMGYAWSTDYCEEVDTEDVDYLVMQEFKDELVSKIDNGNVSLFDIADAINRLF
jgi:hypothetical protein